MRGSTHSEKDQPQSSLLVLWFLFWGVVGFFFPVCFVVFNHMVRTVGVALISDILLR